MQQDKIQHVQALLGHCKWPYQAYPGAFGFVHAL